MGLNDKNIRINGRVRDKLAKFKVKLGIDKGTNFTYSDAIMYLLENQKGR